ncbi:MAG: sulfatase [Planctomycetota bacterium]|nr:sulfatase [Planctomycetota bacterium]
MRFIILLLVLLSSGDSLQAVDRPPNFIVIFCDDLGYGDLGCFGHPTIATPHLDQMAAEGQKWTQFYVAAPVCTPSRAGLLTGRLPIRSGLCSSKRRVLFPDSAGGLPGSEITIPELLKKVGYATGMVGKWHLGHLPEFLPHRHGFDEWYGVPYSNDMDRNDKGPRGWDAFLEPKFEYWDVPLYRNDELIERPTDQRTITKRYGDEAVRFIDAHQDQPFFLYLAHSMPHVPLFRSDSFVDRSQRGFYGDVIEEIDASVGKVLDAVRDRGIAENTIVIFTSDNGPWLEYGAMGGSAGLLRAGKGTTFEGGMRVPTIIWWPGGARPGVVTDPGATLDLLPTFCALAGAEAPADRVLDGSDISGRIRGDSASPRDTVFFYRGDILYAIRNGPWKMHFRSRPRSGAKETIHETPLLYHMEHDPSEKKDLAKKHPEIIERLRAVAEAHQTTLEPVENQMVKVIPRKKPNQD